MFYTLSEKHKFIDDDFKKVFKDFMEFPSDTQARLVYITKFREAGYMWINRYKNKSQYEYAKTLLDDLVRSIEIEVYKE